MLTRKDEKWYRLKYTLRWLNETEFWESAQVFMAEKDSEAIKIGQEKFYDFFEATKSLTTDSGIELGRFYIEKGFVENNIFYPTEMIFREKE